MFAPPFPPSGSRPTSAASHRPPYSHEPYDLPRSPVQPSDRGRPKRSNSYSWRPEMGLPPPPSQIDAIGDNLQYGLVPSHLVPHAQPERSRSRSRSRSPAVRSPSRYDLEFDGLEGSLEHSNTTQMPLNSVSKHPKLKLEIVLHNSIFEAGGTISGRLEVTCTTSQKLRLGEIAVELEGIEELTSRDHAATQLFLYNRTLFQGEHLPPSNAVLPSAPNNGYWTARKGRTTFAFSFRLPATAPSSVTFAGNASLRYHLKASAQTWWNEETMLVTSRREAFVVERWSDEFDEKYQQPVEAVCDTRLFMGGHGAIWLEAGVEEQLFCGGDKALIRCGVKNNTKRQVAGIKVAFARRLIFPAGSADGAHEPLPNQASLEPRITEIVHEQHFKGREYEFPPNEEAVCTVAVDVPRDLRTVRKTRLFEIRIFALVSVTLGSFAKDLTVEIPIYVAHTASVQKPSQEDERLLPPGSAGGWVPHRSHSSAGQRLDHEVLHHGHQHHQHRRPSQSHPPHSPGLGQGQQSMDPQMLAIEQLAAERGWSPAPLQDGRFAQAPSRPASTDLGMIHLPTSAQPFSPSNVSPGQLEWNAAETAWNPSQLMHAYNPNAAIPRSASAAPDLGFAPRSASTAPGPAQMQPLSPVPPQQGWQPPHQHSVPTSPGSASLPIQANAAQLHGMPPHEWASPVDSSHLLQDQHRRNSFPNPFVGIAEQSAVPAPPLPEQRLQSLQHDLPTQMPGPMDTASPAQYAAPPLPQPVQNADAGAEPFGGPGAVPLAGLATIEEDGESQAGTVKSVAALGTLDKPKGSANAGNSVSRNDIEQFEAIARAEEDEEDVKRKMKALGMVPDESAFQSRLSTVPGQSTGRNESDQLDGRTETPTEKSVSAAVHRNKQSESLPKPLVPSGKSQVGASSGRPRASDIFSTAQRAREDGQDAQAAVAALTNASATREIGSKHFPSTQQQGSEADRRDPWGSSSSTITVKPDAPCQSSLRRSSVSQGLGLNALEDKLARSTTPKLTSSPSMPGMTLVNVGHDSERSSSPLVSANKANSSRSRKESALRAAAAAREAALAEKAQQEEEERRRRLEEGERRRVEEQRLRAEEERNAAERRRREEEDRIRRAAAERERLERERQEKEEEARTQAQRETLYRQREEEQKRLDMEAELAAARERHAEEERRAAERARESRRLADLHALSLANSRSVDAPRPTAQPSSPGQVRASHHVELKKAAASRIAGWLSNSNSPSNQALETPGTPSVSVISMLKRDEGQDESKMSFLARSPSQSRNPLYHPAFASSTAGRADPGVPRSSTVANVASFAMGPDGTPSERSRSHVHLEDAVPALSPELRALVDKSDVQPARRAGTALRDHPISRKISTSSQGEATDEIKPSQLSQQASVKRDRHASLPSWPRPGLPNFGSGVRPLPGTRTLEQSSSPMTDKGDAMPKRAAEIFSEQEREIVIPSRVEKTLKVAPEDDSRSASSGPVTSYDARSARGGRGGRVTSVAQLWSNIAGDTVPDADSVHGDPSLAPPSGTFKPKARRTSSTGGAPALDFSQKKKAGATPGAVTAITATFASQSSGGGAAPKPEMLKSGSAPQFLNTSAPRPVFAGATSSASASTGGATRTGERRPLPQPQLPARIGALDTSGAPPKLVRPIAKSPSSSSLASQAVAPTGRPEDQARDPRPRRISTHLLSTFDKGTSPLAASQSARNLTSPAALDPHILCSLPAVPFHQQSQDQCHTILPATKMTTPREDKVTLPHGLEAKMSGRGTTKAIGQGRLRDLKAVWGN